MAERHHSIGEVLSLLKEDHADLTISKIRFFESQGLIDPERTPSGYRKFSEADIDRLRWILTQQRDHFLPLKVIKRRLEEAGFDPAAETEAGQEGPLPEPTLFARRGEEGEPGPGPADAEPSESASDTDAAEETVPAAEPTLVVAPPAPPIEDGDPLSTAPGSVSLSAAELAEAAGLDTATVAELDRLGLIAPVGDEEGGPYDHEALVVARASATFLARGVEPRHLRMFKVSAEREAGVLEQLVGGRLRKGGETAATARDELNELVQLGEQIHRSVLRRSFGSALG